MLSARSMLAQRVRSFALLRMTNVKCQDDKHGESGSLEPLRRKKPNPRRYMSTSRIEALIFGTPAKEKA